MNNQTALSKAILGVALVTVLILLVPLVAMQFTNQVDWGVGDFIIMGALLFGTMFSFVVVIRFRASLIYKAAVGMALGTTFFMIWANLAVGLISSGPNLGNLMYFGIVAFVIIGSLRSRFTPNGMERTMYVSALGLVIIAVIALLANMDEYPGSSVTEILGVNGFFAALFAVSGSLFRYSAQEQSPEKTNG